MLTNLNGMKLKLIYNSMLNKIKTTAGTTFWAIPLLCQIFKLFKISADFILLIIIRHSLYRVIQSVTI